MRRIADITLVRLPWMLIVAGLLVVLATLAPYRADLVLDVLPQATSGAHTFYIVATPPRTILGLALGATAIGLGIALLHRRRQRRSDRRAG